jgi:tRNA (cytosine38-C5)-methyltransferase
MTDRTQTERPSKIPKTDDPSTTDRKTLNFVEFYSGVGGWSMALEAATQALPNAPSLRCVAALDHSDLCTKVYRLNKRPEDCNPTTKNIEKLTQKQVEGWNAAIWAMSPPCQPHTRQHSNQEADLEDPRSKSFLYICQLIQDMAEEKLPQLILLENVVGFETSNSCRRFRQVLASRKYGTAHFHISPTQVEIPNDRPRYYCVAARFPERKQDKDDHNLQKYFWQEDQSCEEDCKIQTQLEELKILPWNTANHSPTTATIASFLDLENNGDKGLRIPEKVLQSNAAWCFDIVTPKDRRTSCFTSAYGKFVKGTGSVLYFGDAANQESFRLVPPEEREFDQDWSNGLDLKNEMRYFSGIEMARMFDFKEGFGFPMDVTRKQQWKLLGNSLNVRVAARMCELGLRVIS